MVTAPVLQTSESSLSTIQQGGLVGGPDEGAIPFIAYRCPRTGINSQDSPSGSIIGRHACHHRHSSSRRNGTIKSNNSLATVIYSVCCICQFASYLPLLVLRVCFGSQLPETQQKRLPAQKPLPSVRTLTGLLLLGLPLMLLASLPIVGRFLSFLTAPPPAGESRSRATSVSSGSRRSYSVCSSDDCL